MKSLARWDPFGVLRRWDPFDEMRSMQHEMDRMFDRFLGVRGTGDVRETGVWTPTIDSFVKDGKLTIKAEVPGIDAKDLEVTVTDRELVIKGERRAERDEKEKEYTYREISYGSFERHFLLPEGAKTEDLKAKFANGILEIEVAVPELPKAKKVQIETRDAKQLAAEPTVKKAA
jgi:HSP20 family protein